MADKLILEVYVDIAPGDVSAFRGPAGEVVMIPFTGRAEGPIFHGVVRPGAVDTQRVNLSGVRHMSARYLLEGEDSAGKPCRIFIENNGWFSSMEVPFKTVPTFLTDSAVLAPYLHQNKFRGEGHGREGGVLIKLFEVNADND